jgi:hypothetical protein
MKYEEFDVISEMRFLNNDSRFLRIYWSKKKVPHFIDLNLATCIP